jgi:hypothetical protein
MAGATARVNDEDEAWEWTQTMTDVIWARRRYGFFFMFFSTANIFFRFLGSYYYVITAKHAPGRQTRHENRSK